MSRIDRDILKINYRQLSGSPSNSVVCLLSFFGQKHKYGKNERNKERITK